MAISWDRFLYSPYGDYYHPIKLLAPACETLDLTGLEWRAIRWSLTMRMLYWIEGWWQTATHIYTQFALPSTCLVQCSLWVSVWWCLNYTHKRSSYIARPCHARGVYNPLYIPQTKFPPHTHPFHNCSFEVLMAGVFFVFFVLCWEFFLVTKLVYYIIDCIHKHSHSHHISAFYGYQLIVFN